MKYSGTNIDDIFILEKMQNLEELSLEISDNDTFYKAKSIAKKNGDIHPYHINVLFKISYKSRYCIKT